MHLARPLSPSGVGTPSLTMAINTRIDSHSLIGSLASPKPTFRVNGVRLKVYAIHAFTTQLPGPPVLLRLQPRKVVLGYA